MLERDREISELCDLLGEAAQGRGGSALITGVTGCGKTETLSLLGERAADMGFMVLTASSTRGERDLPAHVLGQLLRHPEAPDDPDWHAAALLRDDEGTRAACGAAPELPLPDLPTAAVALLHRGRDAVLGAAARRPILICVDDVHYVDTASLHWLTLLLRGIRSARVALVLTECRLLPAHPVLRSQLLRQPKLRQVHLGPLSPDGVASLLAERLDRSIAERRAAACHTASGGIPLLVKALVGDSWHTDQSGSAGDVVVGSAYVDVTLGWLERTPGLLRLCQVLAVLDDEVSPQDLFGRLLPEESPHLVELRMRELDRMGILMGARLRHPALRAALLDTLSGRQSVELSLRIAELLYKNGECPTAVSRHLLAAGRAPASWAVSVLRSAAERLLAGHRLEEAYSCAELALRDCDEVARTELKLLVQRVSWYLNPALSRPHLMELTQALRDGRVPGRHAMPLATHLLWFGHMDEAFDAMSRAGAPAFDDPVAAADLRLRTEVLSTSFPALRARMTSLCEQESRHPGPWRALETLAATSLSRALTYGPDDAVVADAEAALGSMRLTEQTYLSFKSGVAALTICDRLDSAAHWADRALAESRAKNVPTWTAHFSWLRAGVALRKGDLTEARELAESALTHVPPEGWGVVVGGPLADLVQAATEAGDHQTAAAYLDVPVPKAMFQSRFCLPYLFARGRHHAETGWLHAALNDFTVCGASMKAWGFDHPSLLPWRTEAARVHLLLGNRGKAADLAHEHASLIHDRRSRAWGLALRALAAAGDPNQGVGLLTEAVDIFRSCGDRFHLARTLADLGALHQRAGHPDRARAVLRLAARLAGECGAESLLRALPSAGIGPGAGQASAANTGRHWAETLPHAASRLSGAERRVAALAARGHTNREISDQLRITVSTVEQHLTRIYRKLDIKRRENLPDEILLEPAAR
ncbi:AAA family ATPase [Streptomyces capparidis]